MLLSRHLRFPALAGILASLVLTWPPAATATEVPSPPPPVPAAALPPPVRVAQMRAGQAIARRYPNALSGLLRHVAEKTTARLDTVPAVISSFEDKELFDYPYIYVNFADRPDWNLSAAERLNLRQYLERGGFLHIDAGITAEFLRENVEFGQHHSFGEWEARPELVTLFADLFPGRTLAPLPRAHPLFRLFYRSLPEAGGLPESVREYVVNEKWPDGTYSTVALQLQGGRVAVLITPIIAMGWGKNSLGNWETTIRFRVLEGAAGLSESLSRAAYSGARFEVRREDGGKDVVYCQQQALPAWVEEPGGRRRVFQYYGSTEISDFAHVFYTRLATNFLVYAMTH